MATLWQHFASVLHAVEDRDLARAANELERPAPTAHEDCRFSSGAATRPATASATARAGKRACPPRLLGDLRDGARPQVETCIRPRPGTASRNRVAAYVPAGRPNSGRQGPRLAALDGGALSLPGGGVRGDRYPLMRLMRVGRPSRSVRMRPRLCRSEIKRRSRPR